MALGLLQLQTCTVDLSNGTIRGARDDRLTTRELLLLTMLVDRSGEVVTRDELLAAFGYRSRSQSRAVDKAMVSLRAKVEEDRSEPVHLVTVHGSGYRFDPLRAPPRLPRPHPPAATGALVGRASEVSSVLQGVREGASLVLIGGRAGMGKTRLALHVAGELGPEFEGGTPTAMLGGARSSEDAWTSIAAALQIELEGVDPITEIRDTLATRPPTLLLLDGVETVAEPLRDAVRTWRDGAPGLRIIATSALAMPDWDAWRVVVGPLDPASSLELLRLRANGPVSVSEAELEGLVEGLDGMPLAIEFAAARLDALGVAALAGRSHDGSHATPDPLVDTRVASRVRGSVRLLEPELQRALDALGCLPRSFTLGLARQVLEALRVPSPLDTLQQLSAAWLVVREGERLAIPRVVRRCTLAAEALQRQVAMAAAEWAAEHLGRPEPGDAPTPPHPDDLELMQRSQRHAVAVRSSELAIALTVGLVSRGSSVLPLRQWIEPLQSVRDLVAGHPEESYVWSSLGLALRWVPDLPKSRDAFTKAVEAARRWVDETDAPAAWRRLGESQMRLAWTLRDLGDANYREVAEQAEGSLQVVLDRGPGTDDRSRMTRALALKSSAFLAGILRQPRQVLERARSASSIFRALDARSEEAQVWAMLARAHRELGELEAGLAAAEACVARGDRLDRVEQLNALRTATALRFELGQVPAATEGLRECVRRSRTLGSATMLAQDQVNLGTALLHRGRVAEARRWFEDAALDAERSGNRRLEVFARTGLASLERRHGNLGTAERIAHRAASLIGEHPLDHFAIHAWLMRAQIAVDQGDLDRAIAFLDRIVPNDTAEAGLVRAEVALAEGSLDESLVQAAGALGRFRSRGHVLGRADVHRIVARIQCIRGDHELSRRSWHDALEIDIASGGVLWHAQTTLGLAELEWSIGSPSSRELARTLLDESDQHLIAISPVLERVSNLCLRIRIAREDGDLAAEVAAAAEAEQILDQAGAGPESRYRRALALATAS